MKQRFTATGTFSDGSTHALGPAIADIAPGFFGTCVPLTSGGVTCWGYNVDGQLGDGSTVPSLIPRRVKGISKATAVALRPFSHNCALLPGGTVKCWGQWGQNSTVPVAVTGINSATAVAVGSWHSCAPLTDGAVRCWGANGAGQLGDGTNADSGSPVSVTGISTAIALASGENHSCALLASGAVQCWGYNFRGQLGDGTTIDSNTPVTVVGIYSAKAISVGLAFSCALLASGAVRCWGQGDEGERSCAKRPATLPRSIIAKA